MTIHFEIQKTEGDQKLIELFNIMIYPNPAKQNNYLGTVAYFGDNAGWARHGLSDNDPLRLLDILIKHAKDNILSHGYTITRME